MRLLLPLGLAGLLLLPLLPANDRVGAAIGWISGLVLAALSLRARMQALASNGSPLPALVGGFLGRLGLLLGGTLLSQSLALWSSVGFLVACALAILFGEALAFYRLHRAGRISSSVSA